LKRKTHTLLRKQLANAKLGLWLSAKNFKDNFLNQFVMNYGKCSTDGTTHRLHLFPLGMWSSPSLLTNSRNLLTTSLRAGLVGQ
jgi:hypothetical protein